MKILRLAIVMFFMVELVSVIQAIKLVCKYRGRQMTPGQSFTDCYSTVTCHPDGVITSKESCPRYHCAHNLRGFKRFQHRKPFPECCGGQICDDIYKKYYTPANEPMH